MIYAESPYSIVGVQKLAVTATAQTINLNGKAAILQNLGPGYAFISNGTATTNDFRLAVDSNLSPITGTFSVISDSTADVRMIFVDTSV